MDSPWFIIVLTGVAIFGLAWMMPRSAKPQASADDAYERLISDLEQENRELIDAVALFKQEQDETVDMLGRRIAEMEQQMKVIKAEPSSSKLEKVERLVEGTSEIATARLTQEESPMAEETAAESFVQSTHTVQLEAAVLPTHGVPSLQSTRMPPAEPQASSAATTSSSPQLIRDRYPELMQMHQGGRSVEQIAKAIGKNKGEVQLILQLIKREEERYA